jgi:lipoprotein-releasing system ATP-binding protein
VTQSLLVVSDLHKAFRTPAGARLEVLRGISFEVGAGEMLAITGASGAGKSTLLHLLGGLDQRDRGSIRFSESDAGHDAESFGPRKHSIGFVFQFHHLLFDLTAAENIALPLLISRASRRNAMKRANDFLEEMGLAEFGRNPVSHLSGGEQQRVAVARALVNKPRLVLADEPTGNLDTATGDEIGAMLASYCRSHSAAVVIATHNEGLASSCDRVLHLHEGTV